MKLARERWVTDQTGPLSVILSSMGMGYFKLDRMDQYDEFKTLDPATREYLSNETVPVWELVSVRAFFLKLTDGYQARQETWRKKKKSLKHLSEPLRAGIRELMSQCSTCPQCRLISSQRTHTLV